jgi:hypothetical protein
MTGLTYCFYSYKGGVGRSMAVANLAVLFFRRPLDVIVVDWDLEAPGIERYFADQYPSADLGEVEAHGGLSDLIQAYRRQVAGRPEPGEPIRSPYPDLDDHLVTLKADHGCTLSLLTAGDRSDWTSYANFVQSFDWADFYAHWGGGGFFEWLREELVARADLVLIDTRTGVTEMGGVATRQMADVIVVLFAGNEENMASSARMTRSFLDTDEQDRGGRPISVMMVPSRIDDSDSSEFAAFHSRLSEMESLLPRELQDGYKVRDMLLPYRARLAFREQLVIGNDTLETVLAPLVEGYNRIAANMQSLAPADTRVRLGAGVATGRVYLLARPHQIEIELEVRRVLGDRGFEVLPSSPGTDSDPDETELASSTCVLVFLDDRTSSSRQLGQVLRHAERLTKPLIPVMLNRSVILPLTLADIVPLDWSDPNDRPAEELLRAVRAALPPSAGERPVPESPTATAGPRVYLTYSREDSAAARRIQQDLSDRGIETWLDIEQLAAGSEWRAQSQEALDKADALVVLVSPALRNNKYASQEISYTSNRSKRILPLQIAPMSSSDIPLDLANLHILDASGPSYPAAIEAVVNAMAP